MPLHDGEAPLRQPFWGELSPPQEKAVDAALQARHPEAYAALSESLEQADPLDVVYPGNSREYSDVVREVLVLTAHVGGDLRRLSRKELVDLLIEGLARCFGEVPDRARVDQAVELVREKLDR